MRARCLRVGFVVVMIVWAVAVPPQQLNGCAPAPHPGQWVDIRDESALIIWDEVTKTEPLKHAIIGLAQIGLSRRWNEEPKISGRRFKAGSPDEVFGLRHLIPDDQCGLVPDINPLPRMRRGGTAV